MQSADERRLTQILRPHGGFVTGLFRVVTAFVTGFGLVRYLIIKICDGVTALGGWREAKTLKAKVKTDSQVLENICGDAPSQGALLNDHLRCLCFLLLSIGGFLALFENFSLRVYGGGVEGKATMNAEFVRIHSNLRPSASICGSFFEI